MVSVPLQVPFLSTSVFGNPLAFLLLLLPILYSTMVFSSAGCPKKLLAEKVKCDPLLLVEIEELRVSMSRQTPPTDIIEDFTNQDEVEDSQ